MSKLKASVFFCEDMRVENNGQPMFIGLLSPTIELDSDDEIVRSLLFVTMFVADGDIEDFEAFLDVSAENFSPDDDDDFPHSTSKKFNKPESITNDDPWMVISRLDLSGINLKKGLVINCTVRALDYQESHQLIVR